MFYVSKWYIQIILLRYNLMLILGIICKKDLYTIYGKYFCHFRITPRYF